MSGDTKLETLIAQLLDRIDRTYTAGRKQRIRERMTAFWNHDYRESRLPYTAMILDCDIDLPGGVGEDDRELVRQLAAIANHGEQWDDDYYPALSPGCRQLTLASYFGCVEIVADQSVKVQPIITAPDDVYKIPHIGFTPETAGGEMLARMADWRKKTQGRISFYETDMQGPFSVASQIWGIEDFLLACYDDPEAVHHLISACTDAFIEFVDKMHTAVAGDLILFHCQPCLYLPQGKGVALSEDLVAVISPGIVEEFMNPYLDRIAQRFGGVFVHTCGSMNHVLAALCKLDGLIGVNFSSCETDLALAVTQIRDNMRIVCHNSPVVTDGRELLISEQHSKRFGEIFRNAGKQGYCILINFDGSMLPAMDVQFKKDLITAG